MRTKIIFSVILALTAIVAGCSDGGAPANSTANNAAQNANVPVPANNGPLGTTKKPEAPTTNNAPTLGPVFRGYCEALLKKDETAVRNAYSADTLAILDKDSKEEKKSLIDFMRELDTIKDASLCVARNESIDGAKGIAELKSDAMPTWIAVEFVNEGGSWKMTNKSPDLSR